MKFSIRDILGLIVLAALGMIVWRTMLDKYQASVQNSALQTEIKAIETRLKITESSKDTVVTHQLDRLNVVSKMRTNGVDSFDGLRKKYGVVGPTENFSMRSVPSIRVRNPHAPMAYRMYVPKGRSVWLKWGVPSTSDDLYSREPDKWEYFRESPFADSGPFERKLTSGTHTFVVSMGKAVDGRLPFQVSLDDETLLDSAFVATDAGWFNFGYRRMHLPEQQDISTTRFFLSVIMKSKPWIPESRPRRLYDFSVWFEESSTGFAEFPGKRLSQGLAQ